MPRYCSCARCKYCAREPAQRTAPAPKWVKPIPNLLTLARFALIPVYLYYLWHGMLGEATLVYLLALMTDLDGTVARRWNAQTAFGAFFDPVVDAVFMILALGSLVFLGAAPLIPVALYFVSVLFRALPSLAHFRSQKNAASTVLSKAIAFCGFGSVVLATLGTPLIVLTTILLVGTAANIVLTLSWLKNDRFALTK
jgi:phosphatidylglycerophosphate synthase